MSNEKINQLLNELEQQLGSTQLDEDTQAKLAALDAEIRAALASTSDTAPSESLVDSAKQLEARFAAEHPIFERCMREIIDALARMGI